MTDASMPASRSAPAVALRDLDPAVRQSLRYCHRVTRRHARNFYYGLRLTPEPKRSALYAVYAFMRACDDLVDEPVNDQSSAAPTSGAIIQRGLAKIEQFRSQMQQVLDGGDLPAPGNPGNPGNPGAPGSPGDSPWPAFRYVVRQYPIDPAHLHAMLDGQMLDLTSPKYLTFDQLYDYCYKVASVVGLTCIAVWGHCGDPAVTKLAEYRGIALQLTNILRDLVEDAQRQRLYLPAEELNRFGYDPRKLMRREPDAAFDRLMTFQIERARGYYEMSSRLEQYLDPQCQGTSWAIMRIYRGILERIAEDPRAVLKQRVRLGAFTKMAIALRAHLRRPTLTRTSDE
jgi:phytoene synthase